MKKLVLPIVVIILIVTVSACNKKESADEQQEQSIVTLYKSDECEIQLRKMSSNGITFNVINRMSVPIEVMSNSIALDGQTLYGAYAYAESIEAGKTTEIKADYSLKSTEHKTISGDFQVSWEIDGNVDYFLALYEDVNIGDNEAQEYELKGTEVFDNDRLTIWYDYADSHSIYFYIHNKRDVVLNIVDTDFSVNGDTFDQAGGAGIIAPNCIGQYLYGAPEGKTIPDIEYFEANLYTFIQGSTTEPNNQTEDEINLQYPSDHEFESSKKESGTYTAYNNAINLDESQLTQNSLGGYSYNGINIIDSEIEWLEDGAIYRSLANGLEGFYIEDGQYYGGWGSTIVPTVFGFDKPDTWDELKPYVDNASEFIVPEQSSIQSIMKKFSSLNSIDGNFDLDNRTYEFSINDFEATSNELQISTEMLGYILASLEEYAPETSMQPNSYSFSLSIN